MYLHATQDNSKFAYVRHTHTKEYELAGSSTYYEYISK